MQGHVNVKDLNAIKHPTVENTVGYKAGSLYFKSKRL